jgi:hypothetical protein
MLPLHWSRLRRNKHVSALAIRILVLLSVFATSVSLSIISSGHISVSINYQFWPHQCRYQLSVLAISVGINYQFWPHQCRYQLSVLAISVGIGFIIGVSTHLMFRWCRAASRTLALQCLSGSGWQPSANTAISSSPNCTNNSGDPPRVQEEARRERGEVEATSG